VHEVTIIELDSILTKASVCSFCGLNKIELFVDVIFKAYKMALAYIVIDLSQLLNLTTSVREK